MDEDKKFQCSGDCFKCRNITERKVQWQYCAAQHAYNSMRMIEKMQQSIENMQGVIKELSVKIEAIQNSEAVAIETGADAELPKYPLFDNNTAQSGNGVIQ